MQHKFRVGIGQIASVRGDVAHNIELTRATVEQARDAGVQHVVFPELSLTGYLIDSSHEVSRVKVVFRLNRGD